MRKFAYYCAGVCDCCDGGDELNTPRPLRCKVTCPTVSDSSWFGSEKVIDYPIKHQNSDLPEINKSKEVDTKLSIVVNKEELVEPNKQLVTDSIQRSNSNTLMVVLCFIVVLGIFIYITKFSNSSSHGPILATYRRSTATSVSPIYFCGFSSNSIGQVYYSVGRIVRYWFLKCKWICICCTRRGRHSWWDKSVAETV